MKIFLSTICIALLALFAYQVMSFPLAVQNTQKSDQGSDLAKSINYDLPQLAVLKGIDEYSEIVQRPLFVKDRAAAISVQAVNKVTTVNELSHLILVGTASSSDVSIAIVADTKAKKMERLKAGESYQEWEIAEVSSDHVVFQNEKLEYKLFVTPIKDSQKDKQAKLISQLNKSKIEKSSAASKSYKGWKGAGKNNSRTTSSSNSNKPKERVAGKIWGYDKKPENKQEQTNESSKPYSRSENKPAKRSPIKIPGEEEKDAAYYEAEDEGSDGASSSSSRETAKKELSAEDYYDDEDITEDELKALEGLGAKIFDD